MAMRSLLTTFVVAFVLVSPAAAGAPPARRFDDVLALADRGSPSNDVLAAVRRLQRQAGEGSLRDSLEPVVFELLHGARGPVSAEARERLVAARDAAAAAQADQPLISGSMTFGGSGDRQYHLDLGRLFGALSGTNAEGGTAPPSRRPATEAQVLLLKQLVEAGQTSRRANLDRWFHFQHRAVTPEQVAARVSGVFDRYLGHPESLAELAPDLAPRLTTPARAAAFVLRTLRRFGMDLRLPGGSPESVAAVNAEVLELALALEDAFAMVWGGLRTSLSMYECQTGGNGMGLLRDVSRGFSTPRGLAGRLGLTLTDEQAATLEPAVRAQADGLIASLEDFYRLRSERGCDESFSGFLDALLTDAVDGWRATRELRARLART